MSDARDVMITGMGAVSAFGTGAAQLWDALRSGRSGIAALREPLVSQVKVKIAAQVPADFDPAAYIDSRTLPLVDRATQFALVAAAEAIAQSGLDFGDEQLCLRTGVVLGTGAGGETTRDEQSHRLYAEGSTRVHPLTIVRLMSNAAASQICIAHGLRGPAFVVASACASANHALAQAAQLIRSGLADVVISGGTEACLSYCSLRAWEAMRVLADDGCRPFSAGRRGLVLAEGAAAFVLESRAHARSRGARTLARLAGFGMSSDARDIVAPDAAGACTAMNLALRDAGLQPGDVDYINAHGTGTQANDVTETRAIRLCLGEQAAQVAISSTKSMHGHALGAAGALELVAVLGAIANDLVPPTLHLDEPDPQCDLDYVPQVARNREVKVALSNSFAFGGLNAVLAVTRD